MIQIIAKRILRITFTAGLLVMLAVQGVRWANDLLDVSEAAWWIDKHPGWVLGGLGMAALLLLAPARFWLIITGHHTPFIVSQTKPVMMSRPENNRYGMSLIRFYGLDIKNNDSKKTVHNVRVKVDRINPTEGVLVPVGIGIDLDDYERPNDDRRFDLPPNDKQTVLLVAHKELEDPGHVCLLLHTDTGRRVIPSAVQHELELNVVGDDVPPKSIRVSIVKGTKGDLPLAFQLRN